VIPQASRALFPLHFSPFHRNGFWLVFLDCTIVTLNIHFLEFSARPGPIFLPRSLVSFASVLRLLPWCQCARNETSQKFVVAFCLDAVTYFIPLFYGIVYFRFLRIGSPPRSAPFECFPCGPTPTVCWSVAVLSAGSPSPPPPHNSPVLRSCGHVRFNRTSLIFSRVGDSPIRSSYM